MKLQITPEMVDNLILFRMRRFNKQLRRVVMCNWILIAVGLALIVIGILME